MINRCAICGKHHTHEDDSDGGYKLGALFFTHPTSSRFRLSTLPFTTHSHKLTFVYAKYSHSAPAAAFATVASAIPTPGTSTSVLLTSLDALHPVISLGGSSLKRDQLYSDLNALITGDSASQKIALDLGKVDVVY